jgi:hypothetical protein
VQAARLRRGVGARKGERAASERCSGPMTASRAPHARGSKQLRVDRLKGRPAACSNMGYVQSASRCCPSMAAVNSEPRRRTNAAYLVAAHDVQPKSNLLDALALAKDALPAVGEHDGRLMVETLQRALQRSRAITRP